jgi:hypothetical protein
MSKIPNDNRALDYGSAFAVQDPETLKIIREPFDLKCVHSDAIIDEFLYAYDKWIRSTESNTIIGLDQYQYRCYSNGTTEAFDKFYLRNHTRRFRCFRGEYMYHKLAWRAGYEWAWIDEDDIKSNDAVIISLPFADTGDKHINYHSLMKTCNELGVPVLVDCAYFGICRNIEFDFAYNCITDITFSLSKSFPVAYARIGMRYTRVDDDDTMFVYHKINYNNKIGAALGLKFLEKFSPDYIPSKYLQRQLDICDTLQVQPSKTVLFGIGGSEWSQYNRGGSTNRLSFHKQFIKGLENARTVK